MRTESQFLDPAFRGEVAIPGPPERQEETGEAQWPRMLNLDQETMDRLISFLDHEIWSAYTERDRLVKDWEKWQTDYWATPAQEVKNFPFKKAANLVVPMTAIAVEAFYARLLNTLFSERPFWTIRPRSRTWVDAAKPVEDWLQEEFENPKSLDGYHFCITSLIEFIKLGTGVAKSGYEKTVKKTNVPNASGTTDPRYVTVKNGATLDYVPLANFLIRIHETDPQSAQWCGEDHNFTWSQLKKMSASGQIWPEALDRIKNWQSTPDHSGSGKSYQDHVDSLAKTEDIWYEEYTIQEVWLAFDVDGDGYDEEIVVDFHRPSRTLLSVRYNWYDDLRRPYRSSPFIPVEGRFYGIGIGKQNEQFQTEITTIHRQRLDNATLANMRMFAIKRTSGYGPGEPLMPGKMWFLDNPREDIQPIQMGEIYQSSVINEQLTTQLSEKRTGANETILGMPARTETTATGDLVRQQEGNQKFDIVLKNVRRWYGLLGQDVLANFQQFGDQQRHWFVLEEEGQWVEQILTLPPELVSIGAVVDLKVTSTVDSKAVQRQEWMQLFQVLSSHYGQAINLAMSLVQLGVDPTILLNLSQQALLNSDELVKRLLDTYSEPDVDRFLLSGVLNGGNQQGSVGGPTGSGQQTGVGLIPPQTGAV